ncbi:MAG: mannitol-1-phosphate 5-dehydrogenase [Anaerolineae bacterium]|jgi:mannitol-1-phosphate 5-dehydrogenase
MSAQRQSVVFGAGNVGRGFLGQLLSESGYRVLFVDVVEPLVRALAERGHYTLQLVTDSSVEELEITGVSALLAGETERVAEAVAGCDLAATAVGVPALPKLAPAVAAGLERRRRQGGGPLNIIICENLRNAPDVFAAMLREHLSPEGQAYLEQQVGLVDAVIGRMVPLIPPEITRKDPAFTMAEPYKVLPVNRARFRGEIPQVVGMEPRDNFAAYVDQKLFTHNAGHAMIAYLGYLNDYEYGYEALEDGLVSELTEQALEESSEALIRRHGLNPAEQYAHVEDLMLRFRNRRLGDTIFRLGRDPLRKLGPEDRLVGAARLVVETGGEPQALAWGIAAALLFDPPEDESARKLQAMLRAEPVTQVLQKVSGIEPGSELSEAVVTCYESLSNGIWPEVSGTRD